MAGWSTSSRRSELPPDWDRRRARILRRDDGRCVHRNDYGERCPEAATDVDHIVPGHDHSDENLRSLCSWHHAKKSAQEGGRANAIRRAKSAKKFRRFESHPGLIA